MLRTRAWTPWLWIGAVYLLLIALSWKRWANPIVDCGREMYVPWQIAEGKMLYRDLFFLYGPLVPYLHALLFKVFGIHLHVLYAVGLGLVAVQTTLVFVIARRVLEPAVAILAGVMFLIQFAIRPTLGNLVFPYSFNAAYASALNLAALWLVLRHREGRPGQPLSLAGVCVGLSLLSKPELGLAALAFLVCYLAFRRPGLLPFLFCLLPSLLFPLTGYGYFAMQLGAGTLIGEYLWPRDVLAEMRLFHQISVGTLFEPMAIVYLAGLILVTAGGFAAVGVVAYQLRCRFNAILSNLWIVAVPLVLLATPWSDRFVRFLELNHIHAGNLVFLLCALIFLVRKRGRHDVPHSSLFWIALFALLTTWRAPFFAGISGYSAFFMAASVIVFLWVWCEWVPTAWAVERSRWQSCIYSALLCLSALLLARHFTHFRTALTYPLSTPRGELVVHRDIGEPLTKAVAFLQANTEPGEPVLFFPEETSLYFLGDRRSPSKYYQFAPGLLSPERKELELIRAADAAKVRYVFVSNRATTEYGKPYFGVDYYPRLREWIVANFRLRETVGESERPTLPPPPSRYWPSEGYGIDVYERKN